MFSFVLNKRRPLVRRFHGNISFSLQNEINTFCKTFCSETSSHPIQLCLYSASVRSGRLCGESHWTGTGSIGCSKDGCPLETLPYPGLTWPTFHFLWPSPASQQDRIEISQFLSISSNEDYSWENQVYCQYVWRDVWLECNRSAGNVLTLKMTLPQFLHKWLSNVCILQ